MKLRNVLLVIYLLLLLLPIYWMLNMSFKENEEITGLFSLWRTTSPGPITASFSAMHPGYTGYINSLIYVGINTLISVTVALPAAYAFSRYRFSATATCSSGCSPIGWRPPAVFLLPFFQFYSTVGLMDTHIGVALAHMLFNVPLAVWILEDSCRRAA